MKNGIFLFKDKIQQYREEWWENDKLHRIDGPARIVINSRQEWWINGQLHRIDGPAVIWEDGGQEWWKDDVCFGFGIQGFWNFWEELNLEQQDNPTLLMFLPSTKE